ncbi:MAG: RnfABCDGE type electron transport complex subunit D [Tidjanibacter sp.]|nr:RnfABCDGE type electron transport complex subunit D [Tidjanibacter sp.]
MKNKLIVSLAPHLHNPNNTTAKMMFNVVIALMPALIVSSMIYGWRVLFVSLFSVACCLLFEWFIKKYMLGGKPTLCDGSAVVTGLLLAFNLPLNIPLWMVAVGALVAIGVAKMTFGGLGKNPFNPALVGRVFLLVAFPVAMTTFPEVTGAVAGGTTDALSGATPLAMMKMAAKGDVPMTEVLSRLEMQSLFMGIKSGSMGEISAIALLLGFAWLLYKRVIKWHIPVVVLGTMFVIGGVAHLLAPESFIQPLYHILTGGAILGAVYMATDYVTSPMTVKGSVIYAIGIGAITMAIRMKGAYPEGMSFAILIMNSFVPLIDKYILPKRFGAVKEAKK